MPFLGPDLDKTPRGAGNALARMGTSALYGDGLFSEFEDEIRRVTLHRRTNPPVKCAQMRAEGCARIGSVRLLWFVAR